MTSCRLVHPTTSWIEVQRASADIRQREQFIRSISVCVDLSICDAISQTATSNQNREQ
jgi:hypothetical protein